MAVLTRRELAALLAPLAARGTAGGEPRSLFDGSTLAGWSIVDGPESAFYVEDGVIAAGPASGYPAWLRSAREYENFDLEFEFFLKGWMDGGVYFHAPEHGTKSRCGFKISLFHQRDEQMRPNSSGAIFPIVAPRATPVRAQGDWNSMRIRMDWPRLQAWTNGALIHDLDVDAHPDLRYRLRSGYLGLEALSYPFRFRNIRIRELPATTAWTTLYAQPSDLQKWAVTESNERAPARFTPMGAVLRGSGLGVLSTKEKYRDFALELYIRGPLHHNGGIQLRGQGGRNHYEIQLHDVEEAHYPTGSLYFFQRARYPRIEAEKWFLMQIFLKDARLVVRIDGENVLEYDRLEKLDPGFIELQAHDAQKWLEYKRIRVRPL